MKRLVVALFLFSLLYAPFVYADESYNICLNDTVKQTKTYIVLSGSQDSTIVLDENITCSDGCSDTLKDCRWNGLTQVGYSAVIICGFLIISMIGLYVSAKMSSSMFMAILPIVSVLSILVAITDVFGSWYRTIFIVYAFVPIGLMFSGMFKEVEE